MNDRERVDKTAPEEDAGASRRDLERLSKLPLEALLYYVLHGDEDLARLKI